MSVPSPVPFNVAKWSFKLSLPGSERPDVAAKIGAEDAGLVMYDISHDSHYLADDIRVVSIWINPGQENETKLRLGLADFELFSDLSVRPDPRKPEMGVTSSMKPPYQFSDYPTVVYAQAVFQSREEIFPGGSKLRVTQTYVLTDYSLTPAHEPGGVLSAARLFPLLEFEFISENGDTAPDELITNIRFDYRIQYNIDVFLDQDELTKLSNADREQVQKRPQKAALIRDKDPFSFSPLEVIEKPLWYEVIGNGLKDGLPGDPLPGGEAEEVRPTTWDNVHWWGGYKQLHQISAPGAFHAAHLHWRWGKVAQEPAPVVNALIKTKLGEKQFIGTYIGGPLLDPRIPRQDISVILVERGAISELDQDFLTQLTGIRPKPDFIKDGAPLELWMPITVRLGSANKTRIGMVFIHGLYFAHSPAPLLKSVDPRIGTTNEEFKNGDRCQPEQEWVRNPSTS